MKVLYCNKYNVPFSGTEVYLFDLMKLMREHRHETELFSMADERGPVNEFSLPAIDFKAASLSPLRKARLAAHAIYSLSARKQLRQLIQSFHPDVAHIRNIYHHLSPSILWELRAQKVPVLYHVNDFKMLCPSYNFVSKGEACERCSQGAFWNVVKQGCYAGSVSQAAVLATEAYVHRWLGTYRKCVDMILAPSQFVRDKFIEKGWDPNRIRTLYHYQRRPDRLPKSPAMDAPILYFGRLSPEKGVADLIRAMEHLPAIPLQIAGDGPQRAELERLAESLRLANITFLGHVNPESLQPLIARSRFTVLPSHAYETLGKSILESYAHGRAVVASNLGSRPELVQHGRTGLLYPTGDVPALAEAISSLHSRPGQAFQMGLAGLQRVAQHHDPLDHYNALAGLYSGLAEKRRTSPSPARQAAEPPRLRVAFIGGRGVASCYSGIESYYEEVGRNLAQMGHGVTVYCRSYFTPPLTTHNGMNVVRLPTIRTKHLDTLLHTLLSTWHACRMRYDIVHYHALGPALFSWIPRLFGAKTVVTVQGLDWQRKKWGRIATAVLRLGERAAIALPNQTMVVSKTLQQHFRSERHDETVYIPNGTRLRSRGRAERLASWGLTADAYVLFLGRFSPEKNCHLLIEAFERLETSTKLVLAGGSSYTDDYVRSLRRHASDRIRILDWVNGDALTELLTHAALFVLPSDMEGLSLALLDAMGAGVCVLTSAVPENIEAVEGAGFTFVPGNVRDLAQKMELLLGDRSLRKEAGRAAKQKVQRQYLWSQVSRDIEHTYLELMGVTGPIGVRPTNDWRRPHAA